MKLKILFVCIENSCRSQMAEGLAKKLGAGLIEPYSAGSNPSGKVNENAVTVMSEKGINIKDQTSKGFTDLPPHQWDHVITMGCGDACPYVPSKKKLDWDLADPKNKPLDEYRKTRDDIERRLKSLFKEINV